MLLVVPWSCRFGGTWDDVLGVLGPDHLSGDKCAAEASPDCCLLHAAASVCTGTWCAHTWGEEGKVCGQPCLQRAQCVCGSEHHLASCSLCAAINLVIWRWGSASFGPGGWWGPVPKSSAAVPAHTSPCGPCLLLGIPVPAWDPHAVPAWRPHCTARPWSVPSPAPPGSCFFLNRPVPRLPAGAAVLACRGVLHLLQRWRELPGPSCINEQGQPAGAEAGGVQRGTMGGPRCIHGWWGCLCSLQRSLPTAR